MRVCGLPYTVGSYLSPESPGQELRHGDPLGRVRFLPLPDSPAREGGGVALLR